MRCDLVRFGRIWFGLGFLAGLGTVQFGGVGLGEVRYGFHNKAGRGAVRFSGERYGFHGQAVLGMLR